MLSTEAVLVVLADMVYRPVALFKYYALVLSLHKNIWPIFSWVPNRHQAPLITANLSPTHVDIQTCFRDRSGMKVNLKLVLLQIDSISQLSLPRHLLLPKPGRGWVVSATGRHEIHSTDTQK